MNSLGTLLIRVRRTNVICKPQNQQLTPNIFLGPCRIEGEYYRKNIYKYRIFVDLSIHLLDYFRFCPFNINVRTVTSPLFKALSLESSAVLENKELIVHTTN